MNAPTDSPDHPHTNIALWATILLFAAIQVQTTYSVGNFGIRISLSDAVLLVAALLVATSIRISVDPSAFYRRPELLCLGLALGWLTFSIINGRLEIGYWQSWALLNRGAGIVVLLFYFCIGWIAASSWQSRLIEPAMRVFLLFFWASCFFSAGLMVAFSHRWFDLTPAPEATAGSFEQMFGLITGTSRFQGFMVNPNAFGLLAATALISHIPFIKSKRLFDSMSNVVGLAISIFGLAWSMSRGAWIAGAGASLLLVFLRRADLRILVTAAAFSAVLSLVLWLACWTSPTLTLGGNIIESLVVLSGSPDSARLRWVLADEALALWREAPLTGAGVGMFLERQLTEGRTPLATIHSTYLWLLAETGVIGLLLFGAYIVTVLRTFWHFRDDHVYGDLFLSLVGLLGVFLITALAMEVMYQRHIWLFLGLGFGIRAKLAEYQTQHYPGKYHHD